jgi:hypothetical protein
MPIQFLSRIRPVAGLAYLPCLRQTPKRRRRYTEVKRCLFTCECTGSKRWLYNPLPITTLWQYRNRGMGFGGVHWGFRLVFLCDCVTSGITMNTAPDPNEFARKVLLQIAGLRAEVRSIHIRLAELFAEESGEDAEEVQRMWIDSARKNQKQLYLEMIQDVGLPPQEGKDQSPPEG